SNAACCTGCRTAPRFRIPLISSMPATLPPTPSPLPSAASGAWRGKAVDGQCPTIGRNLLQRLRFAVERGFGTVGAGLAGDSFGAACVPTQSPRGRVLQGLCLVVERGGGT